MPKDTQTRKSDLGKELTTALTWSLAAILDPEGKEGTPLESRLCRPGPLGQNLMSWQDS